MKILNIATGFDLSYNGGITNYVREISESLIKKGHDVLVVYSNDNGSAKTYTYEVLKLETLLKPFHLSNTFSNRDLTKIENLLIEIKPDVINLHMMIDLPLKVLDLFLKYSKLVITLHDYFYICKKIIKIDSSNQLCYNSDQNTKCDNCINIIENSSNKYINNRITQRFNIFNNFKSINNKNRFLYLQKKFKEANLIIAVSDRVKQMYEIEGFTNENFIVNTLGSYTSENDFKNSFYLHRKTINSPEKIKLGFIGSFTKHKGGEMLIELVKHTNHEFHVYGRGDKLILDKLSKYDNFIFHGEYSHDSLKNILSNIDLGIVLSVWEECFGLITLEYLNSYIPVIGTDIGATPSIINDRGKVFKIDSNGINDMINFINSDEIYKLYNEVINKKFESKKIEDHVDILNQYLEVI